MAVLIQFIVLKREGKWVIKSKDLERVFSSQREAVDAAIRFANDSGKEGKPGVVLLQKSKTKFEKVWTYDQSSAGPDLPIASRTPSRKNWRAPSIRRNTLARPAGDRHEPLG